MYSPPSYRSRNASLPSDHSLSFTQPPIFQSAPRLSTPNSRTSLPQAPTTPYVSHGTIAETARPQAPRKIHSFVASDPFRLFRDGDSIDVTSDGLTFDDIPTAEFAPRTELSQGRVSNHHGALPGQTFRGSLPNITPPPVRRYYPRSSSPIQSTTYPLLNNSRAPEAPINQIPKNAPFTSSYQVGWILVSVGK